MKKISVLFIILLFSLSACSESINGESSVATTQINSSGEINEIVRNFDSGLVINANIYPENVEPSKAYKYKGEVKRLDFDLFYENLLKDKIVFEETEEEMAESFFGDKYKFIRYDDTAFFTFMEHSATYAGLATLDISAGLDDLNLPFGQSRFNYIGEDLKFISVDDANTIIRELFANLDVQVIDLFDCYTLQKNQIPIITEDGYIFEYYIGKDEIPVTKNFYGSYTNGVLTLPSSINVEYTKDGIMSVNIGDVYSFLDKIGEETAFSVDEAVEKLEAKYKNVILDKSQTVTGIEFSYYPVPTEEFNVFEMTPAWTFYIVGEGEFDMAEEKIVVFNAIDGTEMLAELGG